MSSDGENVFNSQAAKDAPVRERKMTEKGRLNQIETRKKNRKKAYINLNKHIALVFESIQQEKTDLEHLEYLRDRLDRLKDQFNEAQKAYDDVLEDERDKSESYIWFDLRDRETVECRLRLSEAIRANERKIAASSCQSSVSFVRSRSTKR